MPKKVYPYQDTSLKNLRGEKWKDIPGFEDYYQLSNYGRIKSLERWVDMGRYDQLIPERMVKPRLGYSKGSVHMQMKLHKEKKRYYFSLSRYVYFLFVAPFDVEDHSLIVTSKDGDLLFCYYKNLALKSISEIAKEGFATGKRTSAFQLTVKPVTQYDSHGKKIAHYPSTKMASEKTGISPNYINDAARTQHRMAGGFYWRYGKAKPQLNIARLNKPRDLSVQTRKGDSPNHYHLNRMIATLPGEKWKAIAGYEGLYEVSNFGRIKSLQRLKEMVTKNGKSTQFWTKAFIRKQTVGASLNQYLDEPASYLTVALKKDGAYTGYSVARLVYAAFGKDRSDLGDKMIIHRDKDNLHNHISNLDAKTYSDIHKASFQRKRRSNPYARFTLKQRQVLWQKAAQANYKPITQYNLLGKRIAVFDSIVAAATATGLAAATISNAVNGRLVTAGGFIWKNGKGDGKIDTSAIQERLRNKHMHKAQKVAQYTLEGKKIAVFDSFVEAAKQVKGDPKQLSHAARGLSQTSYGYKWKLVTSKGKAPK